MLDFERQGGHQAADHHQRGSEHHARLSRESVGDEAEQHNAQDLSHNQRVGNHSLVRGRVQTTIQMSEYDIDICRDLLLVAI